MSGSALEYGDGHVLGAVYCKRVGPGAGSCWDCVSTGPAAHAAKTLDAWYPKYWDIIDFRSRCRWHTPASVDAGVALNISDDSS